MSNISSTLAHLNSLRAEVVLMRHPWPNMESPWSCSITLKQDGTEIKTIKSAPTADEAVALAWEAVERFAQAGLNLRALAAPQVEGTAE